MFSDIDNISLLVSVISLVPLPNIILLAAFTQILTPSHKPQSITVTYLPLKIYKYHKTCCIALCYVCIHV